MDVPRIVLIGLRGSGKSTLARQLATALGWDAIDLDDITPGLLGPGTLREVWDRVGEEAFRIAEAEALRQSLGRSSVVLALGGGTPTAPGADTMLRDAGTDSRVIYLQTSPGVLRDRLRSTDNADRPALTGSDPLTEIGDVYGARDPLYRALATEVLACDDLSAEQAMELILSDEVRS